MTLQEVLDAVRAERTHIDSLATLTRGIKQRLDAVLAGALTPDQQAKVDAVFAEVQGNTQAIDEAVNENTDAPPATPPAEPPAETPPTT